MSACDETQAGQARFLEMLKEIDPAVAAVIPVRATNGNFLISLTRKKARKFITLNEDDLSDLPEDEGVQEDVASRIRGALDEMPET